MIESIEIENPYHYRGYTVGYEPVFNIQNDMFTRINDHGKVVKIGVSIDARFDKPSYVIVFEDGAQTTISYSSNLIVTQVPANEP